jgi:GNAT superfamily N-acetyltransferase
MSSQRVAQIADKDDSYREAAVDLLARFFREEGFATPRDMIARNLQLILADDGCWTAVALHDGQPIGVVTVTTMLYVEWGRLAEIGDLYVDPAHRDRGFGRLLVSASLDWSRRQGCNGVYVTVTPEGEARHQLSHFYQRLKFEPTGRTTMMFADIVRGGVDGTER